MQTSTAAFVWVATVKYISFLLGRNLLDFVKNITRRRLGGNINRGKCSVLIPSTNISQEFIMCLAILFYHPVCVHLHQSERVLVNIVYIKVT